MTRHDPSLEKSCPREHTTEDTVPAEVKLTIVASHAIDDIRFDISEGTDGQFYATSWQNPLFCISAPDKMEARFIGYESIISYLRLCGV